MLLDCLLAMSRDEEAGALLMEHDDDGTAAWLYGYALWAFRREGDGPESRRRSEGCADGEPARARLPARAQAPAFQLPDSMSFGGEDEAVSYVADSLGNWQATDGALSWLARAK